MFSWPRGLKQTAIRKEWFERISRLAPGMDVEKAARVLRQPYGAVRRWGVLFGYRFPDRRRSVSKEQWAAVDWTKRDADIARELGVTRECVRLVRRARGMGPSAAQATTRELEHFIQVNRERLHGLLVEDVISQSGTTLAYHVVRRILRENDVEPHEPQSPLRNIDWRLPNRDLARIWGASPRYIANLRARLGVGPANWNARRREIERNPKYAALVAQERNKAQSNRRNKSKPVNGKTRPMVLV